MKIFKKLLSAVLASTMVVGMSIGAWASNDKANKITATATTKCNKEISICKEGICTGNDGNHIMIYRDGCAWQCRDCKLVLITYGDPLLDQKIGHYASWGVNYDISLIGTTLFTDDIYYCNSTKLDDMTLEKVIYKLRMRLWYEEAQHIFTFIDNSFRRSIFCK